MLFIVLTLFFGCSTVFAEKANEAQGDGPFKYPLEPADNRLSAFGVEDKTFKGYCVIHMVPKTSFQVAVLMKFVDRQDLQVSFWKEPSGPKGPVDMMIGKRDFNKVVNLLAKIGLRYKVFIKDVGKEMESENLPHSGTTFSTYTGYDYGRYHQYHEIHRELKYLANRYSNLAQTFSLGRTYEGRDMLAIKISSGNCGSGSKKTFFYNCGIHAREWVSPATCMYMINQMLSKYNTDSSVKAMVDRMDWVVLPVFNVDGYAYSWRSTSTRFWRKTRRPNRNSRCVGTDPNRNWDTHFGGVGTSKYPCSQTYHGGSPFSEIEVKQVADYLKKTGSSLAGYVDIHAYSQLWMYPWGYTKTRPRDYQEMDRVGRLAIDAIYKTHRKYYKAGSSSVIIYATTGGSNDWVYEKLGVVYAYALELRDTGRYGFLLPATEIIPTGEETFAGFKAMVAAMKI